MSHHIPVVPVANGVYRVDLETGREVFYVAGSTADRWVFWNGRVFHGSAGIGEPQRPPDARPARGESLVAPMPARVLKLLVQPGGQVKKGDTVVLLEAMKMELPIRAPADATVIGVHCREGELVEAEAVLVDLL